MKCTGQDVLDPVKLGPDVRGGETGDLTHRFGVDALQVTQNQLAINGLEFLD